MAFPFHYSSKIIFLALFFLGGLCQNDKPTQELIDKICRQMEEYGFCNKVFNENLPSPSTDIAGLTKITINQSLKNATNTHTFIVQLLQKTTDPAEKNALIACENGYKIVLESFKDALKKFDQKDYEGVTDSERGTPRAQERCIISFDTPPNPPNPLVDRNREMRILVAMALVSAHLLNSN